MTVKVKKMTQKQFDAYRETDEYDVLHTAFYKAYKKVYNARVAYDHTRRGPASFEKIRKAHEKLVALEAGLPINPEAYEPGFKWN
jgi:hypothetical protein